ncbi:hypothetical protein B0T22DRAFT_445501 [Podospora appendiculata]|uniref:WW domain-containing protein n=1 Tax=Podospora appendiculata TaxID=314037 RepID=A0AAE0WZE8_9PEZI|nr:hypothetical protein B0T22DRAFT_445501 [Podospora appendiculata]
MATPIIEPPPSYAQATSTNTALPPQPHRTASIPLHARRSMEDELRALPEGWVRTFDPASKHQFFVDTFSDPSRSIWHHPYDDEIYMSTLPPAQRANIRGGPSMLHHAMPSRAEIAAESTDDDDDDDDEVHHARDEAIAMHHRDRDMDRNSRTLGRRLKDKLTGTTHEQRVAERARRETEEMEMYREHQAMRRGMEDAMRSGEPQLLGKDNHEVDLYLEPPGRTFPGVVGVKKLSPYMVEVFYEEGQRPGPPGRYVRPEGEMYGYGYGGYDCDIFGLD